MKNRERPKPHILKEVLSETLVFTLPALSFSHRFFIKISCFFRNGSWTSFFLVFSRILPEKSDFETPAGPSWDPNGDQDQPNSRKNMEIELDGRSLFAFWKPPCAPEVAQGSPKTAQGAPSLIFYRFWMDFS